MTAGCRRHGGTPVSQLWRTAVIGWRLGHMARRAAQQGTAWLVRSVAQRRRLHRLPRLLMVPVERALVRAADANAFDADVYLARNPDVHASGRSALDHYLRWGWAEGRDPRADLSEKAHRDAAGLEGAPVSALAHAIATGTLRLREAPEPPADLPPLAELLARIEEARPECSGAPQVDVIVPVYRGRQETLNCLLSLFEASNRTPSRIVVVDDRGPDRMLREDLARLARRGLIELIVQPRNLGFVAAINAGMARHPDRDVIWLNSDTEVYGDWIDRLRRVAGSDPTIATVTPLTNNGTIASYPRFDRDNPTAPECGWATLDRLAASANEAAYVEAPTCVGFCTYVRRRALRQIGPLDQALFGRGYGEENDFSRRAVAAGWRNVIAGGVFVRHLGATSFGAERAARVDQAMRTLVRRHPEYPGEIARYASADPPRSLRERIDVARLAAAAGPRPVLIVSHGRGGGTARHVGEEIGALAAAGRGAILMAGGARQETVRLTRPGMGPLPSLEAVPFHAGTLSRLLRSLGITGIDIHHLVELPADAPRALVWLADALDLPLDVTVHDYFSICPRINLADLRGRYCGEPGPGACRRCLLTRRSDVGAPDILAWRKEHGTLLRAARLVRVPDADVADRLLRHFPGLKRLAVRPHEQVTRPAPPVRRAPGPLRIAAIGAIGPIKGFDVLLRLATHVRQTGAPVSLTVIGHTRNDRAARAAGIAITGRYAEGEIAQRLEEADPDVILIPSTWPETFCYTLSHALRSGRPVAVFDLGAQARRLRAFDEAEGVLPLAFADDPRALLERLTTLAGARAPRLRAGRAPEPVPQGVLATAG